MNPNTLNRVAISYVQDFLEEMHHLRNRLIVKCIVAKMDYGSILKIKVYRQIKGQWSRFSKHICRVKSELDIAILQSTLNHFQNTYQFMCDNMRQRENNDSDTD